MLTQILLKIFAYNFYRVHAGLFLVMFLVLFGIMEPSEWYGYQKNLILAFVITPVCYCIVLTAWLLYAVKVLHHTLNRLFSPEQKFLFYSINSFSKRAQFKSWVLVYLVMLLPVMIYGIPAVVISFYCHNYLPATGIILYLFFLTGVNVLISIKVVNNPPDGGRPLLLRITGKWPKPLFSLYIYHIFHGLKLHFLITKVFSWLIIFTIFYFFNPGNPDLRIAEICLLLVAMAHTVLIYQEHRFEDRYMNFIYNMPYGRDVLFLNFIPVYSVILLPEVIWLFNRFDPATATELYLFVLSLVMSFHILAYITGISIIKYLKLIFALFLFFFIILMLGFFWLFIICNVTGAFLIYYHLNYWGN